MVGVKLMRFQPSANKHMAVYRFTVFVPYLLLSALKVNLEEDQCVNIANRHFTYFFR